MVNVQSRFGMRSVLTVKTIGLVAAALLLEMSLPQRAEADTAFASRFADLYAAAKKEKEVVYYTTGRPEENDLFSRFWNENFPDVRLRLVAKQSLEQVPVVEAEKAAGRTLADVVSINEPYISKEWKRKGYYLPYKTQAFAKLAPDYADSDGAYYVPSVFLLTASYNTKAFPDKSQLPKKLADFYDQKWKSKLVLAHPLTAGSDLFFFMGLLQLKKTDWDGIRALGKQNVLFVRGNAEAARMVASGERPLSPMVSTQNVLTSREKGQPIDFYVLDEGSIVMQRLTGIFSGGPHPNAAKLLLEVLTSVEGQENVAVGGAFWPTHPDATPPGHLPKLSELKPINFFLDADEASQNQFIADFDKAFGRE